MQTQCPHCDTRFRVTQTQVDAADGILRCGICKEIFNAFEVADQHEYQDSLLSEGSAVNEATQRDTDTIKPDSSLKDHNQPSNEDFDLFGDNELSASSIIPDEFRETHAQQPWLFTTALWSIGILFLIATLILQHIWFNQDQFNKIPEIQAGIEKLCQHIDCKKVAMRDPSKIELISRNVYSHPEEENALVIDLTIQNNADFAQPYPVMQVDFSNVRGNIVAARRFLPKDYLQTKIDSDQQLEPNEDINLLLEIQDPGKSALTYEFNFL